MSSRVPLASATVAAVLAAAPIAAGAAPAPIGPAATSDTSAELVECLRGKRVGDRSALFRGEMRQVEGASAMRMRFQLGERVGRGGWRVVKAPGLGVWRTAAPGVLRFAYRQRIAGLQRGTAYRVGIVFQWQDSAGATVARQVARSPVCRQRGPLPNVRVGRRLEQSPGPTPGTVRYVVAVVNVGGAPARGVDVRLSVDGAEVDTRRLVRVGAHSRRAVAFVGPACAGAVAVDLDPAAKLRELDTRDNSRSFACPP
jgi:hypothetical protein